MLPLARSIPCSTVTSAPFCYEIEHAAEAEAVETSIVDGKEEQQDNGKDAAGGAAYPSSRNLPFGEEDLNQGRDAEGNNRRRNLRKNIDNYGENSRRRHSEGTPGPSARSRRMAEEHRRLEREVSEGMEAARIRDPDVDAKDEDLRLLGKYMAASPPEQDAFHERGVRRLSSEKMQMPSGRILTSSVTIDVMVLYTSASMVSSGTGTLMTETQMETDIIAAFAGANDAFVDSGIDAVLNVVHMEKVS